MIETSIIATLDDQPGWDHATARNYLASICQFVTDFASINDLVPYVFLIDQFHWQLENKFTSEVVLSHRNLPSTYLHHPAFLESIKTYAVVRDGEYVFGELWDSNPNELIADSNFRKSTFHISAALRYAHHTVPFCIAAVESVRAHFDLDSDGRGRKRSWERMRAALGNESLDGLFAVETQAEKHGRVVERTWAERAIALATAIEVLYRFGLHLKTRASQAA